MGVFLSQSERKPQARHEPALTQMNRHELRSYWDREVARWERREPLPPELEEWQNSYSGWRRNGQPEAMPEPFIGNLLGTPKAILLGNNPGAGHEEWQGREGHFARQVAEAGYTAWAATRAYDGEEWERERGVNRYHRARHVFLERYLEETLSPGDVLTFELYPWHSPKLDGRILVPQRLLWEFIVEPLRDVPPSTPIFAIGAMWAHTLDNAPTVAIALPELSGVFRVRSRRLRLYRLAGADHLVAVISQSGFAVPPAADDVEIVRRQIRSARTTT